MNPIEVHPIEVRGQKYQVRVDESGMFHAEHGGKRISSETLGNLRQQLGVLTRKAAASVEVPFVYVGKSHGAARRAVATGRHGGNGNILFRDGTRSEQWTGYSDREVFRDIPGHIESEFYRLREDRMEANRAYETFAREYRLDLGQAVDEAIAAEVARNGGE